VASAVCDFLAYHVEGDVRDSSALKRSYEEAEPEVIFHLAAQPLVRKSYSTPCETFDINVLGTAKLLEVVRCSGRPCSVIVITSDKCYDNENQTRPFRESDPLGGFDPYSASKGAAELVVAAYRRSFFPPDRLAEHGVKLASARAGNVIGGGDWAKDRILPDAARCLAAGQPLPVRNPSAVRPWQHVLEPLSGYLMVAARMLGDDDPRWCEAWNFGPHSSNDKTVGELVELFCQAWDGGQWHDASDSRQPYEAATLRLNVDKAVQQLGWRPKWPLHHAVQRTARWYKQFYRGTRAAGSMLQTCLDDIAAYERDIVEQAA
jgi:CDP-glucose 4,6-dehydratase